MQDYVTYSKVTTKPCLHDIFSNIRFLRNIFHVGILLNIAALKISPW